MALVLAIPRGVLAGLAQGASTCAGATVRNKMPVKKQSRGRGQTEKGRAACRRSEHVSSWPSELRQSNHNAPVVCFSRWRPVWPRSPPHHVSFFFFSLLGKGPRSEAETLKTPELCEEKKKQKGVGSGSVTIDKLGLAQATYRRESKCLSGTSG